MEIELKYNIPGENIEKAIWENELFSQYEEEGSREEVMLDNLYFDTEECDLEKNEIAYRIRCEKDRLVASLKWKGHSEDGLHVREEINVPVTSSEPDPEVFEESKVGSEFMELVDGKELKCFMEMKVFRRRFRIDVDDAIFEISLDSGEMITEKGNAEIHEVEVELFSGDTDSLVKVGNLLQEKYGLEPEDKSKYARGIELIKRHK
ncbi:MAG: CYTH domain-containing protein [Firmicutes bacterium]|nr:CYTH domain-containing protein [Bacillota bacterium]